MRHIVYHTRLDRWHWLMWIVTAILAMAFLLSSITATESHAHDSSSQGLSLPQLAVSPYVTAGFGTGSSADCTRQS